MSFRIGGIASGFDTDTMVRQLMQAERMPLDRLFQQKQWLEWQQQAYRDVNLSLANFRDSFSSLRFTSTYNGTVATSSNQNVVSAKTTAGAVAGTYTVSDIRMAKLAKLHSENAITNLDGNAAKGTDKVIASGTESFTITNGQGLEATIEIDENDTYASLATKISNAKDDNGVSLGIRATFDNTTSRFFINSREMGADQGFTLENTAFVQDKILGGGSTFSQFGEDGSFRFDGIEITGVTSSTVRVNGIDITLHEENTVDSFTIRVQSNTDEIFNSIKNYIASYNELIATLESKVNEPKYRDFAPLTDEQRRDLTDREAEMWDEKAMSGLLRNDPILRSVINDLRSAFTSPVDGIPTGEINILAQIGITTGNFRDGGKLFINEDRLRQALGENPDQVANLFAKVADDRNEKGVNRRIYDTIETSVRRLRDKAGSPGTGSLGISTIGQEFSRINNQISRWEDRLIRVENRYWKQFTAMEQALQQLNSQSSWIASNMFGGQ